MDLQPRLDARLWKAIQGAYEAHNYTTAILDSIQFLFQLIRDKSGLESDGVALVGAAFGGVDPKLKTTKLQTESDKSIQQGTLQLLSGIYQGIRNPRSHGKHSDSSDDADAIILFVNYLIKIIDNSKTPFEKSSFVKRIFDPYFVENLQYATYLVDEIPARLRLSLAVEVFRGREAGDGAKLRYFFLVLLKQLTGEEVAQFCDVVSEDLKVTHNLPAILSALKSLPDEYWPSYSEVARLRIENLLIKDVKEGMYDPVSEKCLAGTLGTWASGLCRYFILKDELLRTLTAKLASSSAYEQIYALQFFGSRLGLLEPVPSNRIIHLLSTGLKAGDVYVYQALSWLESPTPPQPWLDALKGVYESFTPAVMQGEDSIDPVDLS
jgi:uncharacterized protein (TIGR02391 family)